MIIFQKRWLLVIISALAVIFNMAVMPVWADTLGDQIAQRTKQIEQIQRQIDEYQRQIDENRSKALTLQTEIDSLNSKIKQLNLEIKGLSITIEKTNFEIKDDELQIEETENKIEKGKITLTQYLRFISNKDQRTVAETLLLNGTISNFFDELHGVRTAQDNLQTTITSLHQLRDDLTERKEALEGRKTDLERLKSLQEIQKRSLDSNKTKVGQILKETKGQESKFQELVKKSQLDINRIKSQITYLQQNGISAEDAVKYAQLAAIGANIRPEFLLAILEIETRLGQNIGKGNWSDDMYQCYLRLSNLAKTAERRQFFINRANTEKNAFFAIIGKLGLNPDAVKVSKEPRYGCGGAMGPAQFIPSTWLGYEAEVTRITGHSPANPWSVEDAFTAAAIKLANGGATAKTRAGESAAARAYIGGSRTCSSSICNYYSSTVLRKADEIDQSL